MGTGKRFRRFWFPSCFSTDGEDCTFVDSTWLDFFQNHVVSRLSPETIVLNCPVECIDYRDIGTSKGMSKVICSNCVYQAKYVVVTVSMSVLQANSIQFNRVLEQKKWAIDSYKMGNAIKMFIRF